jgi:hypothetical protein
LVLICVTAWWFLLPKGVTATSLFEVRRDEPFFFGKDSGRPLSKEEFEILKKTQLALLKSKYVLSSSLVNPGIASLSVLASADDKEAWLQDQLVVEFPQGGEILSISLHGSQAQKDDLVALDDAIAGAYKKEVLGQERQRKLTIRDMVAKSLENLNSELKRKSEDFLDIARGMKRPTGNKDDQFTAIYVKRLDRADAEIMRLEGEQLKNETAGEASEKKEAAFLAKRLDQLRKQKEELVKTIEGREERSVELETRQEEIKQLQSLANDMSVRLETLDIDLETPPRIRQIQQAVATSEGFASW